MKKVSVLLMTVIILVGLAACSDTQQEKQQKPSPENAQKNAKESVVTAGCKGDACNFAKVTAKKNSEGRIISITVRNLKSEPVNIQVELTNFMGYSQKPWSRYSLGGNESETEAIDPAKGFIGVVVKRANVIVE